MLDNMSLENDVNNWLFKSIVGNNGELYQYTGYELDVFRNSDYCQELFSKIIEILKKNNYVLQDEERFKDRLIYIIYKYSEK